MKRELLKRIVLNRTIRKTKFLDRNNLKKDNYEQELSGKRIIMERKHLKTDSSELDKSEK